MGWPTVAKSKWTSLKTGDIEFMGEIVGSTIVFGEADAEPLLGVTALESVGIEIDPRNQKLTRNSRASHPRGSRTRT